MTEESRYGKISKNQRLKHLKAANTFQAKRYEDNGGGEAIS